jgi:hypothetical protein
MITIIIQILMKQNINILDTIIRKDMAAVNIS